MAEQCMGCLTSAGAAAADEVYRDEHVVAVVARHALNPGHLVVVSHLHAPTAFELPDRLLAHMTLVGRELARRLQDQLPYPGSMLVFNIGDPAQTLFHTHLHVIPRQPGDEMHRKFGREAPDEERAARARRLQPFLNQPIAELKEPSDAA